jgi:hypothetical protein
MWVTFLGALKEKMKPSPVFATQLLRMEDLGGA